MPFCLLLNLPETWKRELNGGPMLDTLISEFDVRMKVQDHEGPGPLIKP